MSTPDSSMSLRAHLDAVFDPIYERLFTVLDARRAAANRPTRHAHQRAVQLQRLLSSELAALDAASRDTGSAAGS